MVNQAARGRFVEFVAEVRVMKLAEKKGNPVDRGKDTRTDCESYAGISGPSRMSSLSSIFDAFLRSTP